MTKASRIGPLFTDLYELTMAASYYEHKMFYPAIFTLFVRGYPVHRNYYVAAGLEDALRELEKFKFSKQDLRYLKTTHHFSDTFLSFLEALRFSGDIFALQEGTIFFENEPILEVEAPLIEAQLIETFLLNTIGFQTLVASKAARCIHAAKGLPLIDFSLRRTQGQDAGLHVARSTYIVGFAATSNVLAGKIYQIPVSGTMAHSFVTAFEKEIDAFAAYSKTFPKNAILLIDTYDTLEGARNAVRIAREMKTKGESLMGVRLDSGDMVDLSKKVRNILDDAGLHEVKILASSGFDEYGIKDVLSKGAKIDGFGVGTKMGVSADAPYLDIVYKLSRLNDRDVRKLSPGKVTLAGKKQVFRKTDSTGTYREDIIGLRDDQILDVAPLMECVMKNGKVVHPYPALSIIRERFQYHFSHLPEVYKSIDQEITPYPVKLSCQLMELQDKL